MGNCISNTGSFEPPGAAAVRRFEVEHALQTDPRMIGLRLAQQQLQAQENAPPPTPPKPKGPKCSICKSYVDKTVNPWQLTRIDLLSIEMSDDSDAESDTGGRNRGNGRDRVDRRRSRLKKRGIELKPCSHVFCGVSVGQSF